MNDALEPRVISFVVGPPVDRLRESLWVGDVVARDSELFDVSVGFDWRVTRILIEEWGATVEGVEYVPHAATASPTAAR